MSTHPAPRQMPDTLWLLDATISLGDVSDAIKDGDGLIDAIRAHIDMMHEWEADAANAAQRALLTPEANRRIMAKIYRQIEKRQP